MKVTHFVSETFGGAGVAVQRLHQGLIDLGAESRFIHGQGYCDAPSAARKPAATNYLLRIKADLLWGVRYRLNARAATS